MQSSEIADLQDEVSVKDEMINTLNLRLEEESNAKDERIIKLSAKISS